MLCSAVMVWIRLIIDGSPGHSCKCLYLAYVSESMKWTHYKEITERRALHTAHERRFSSDTVGEEYPAIYAHHCQVGYFLLVLLYVQSICIVFS